MAGRSRSVTARKKKQKEPPRHTHPITEYILHELVLTFDNCVISKTRPLALDHLIELGFDTVTSRIRLWKLYRTL